MVGEVVRVTPGDAVEGDVEKAVLEATDRSRQVFHHARTVRIHGPHARCELDDVGVVGERRIVVLDELTVDDRARLRCHQRTLGRRLIGSFDLARADDDLVEVAVFRLIVRVIRVDWNAATAQHDESQDFQGKNLRVVTASHQ